MVRSVQDQLADFRKSMEADGAAQRAECRRLVSTAVRRAGWLVDEVLQVTPLFQVLEHSLCAEQPHHFPRSSADLKQRMTPVRGTCSV